MSSCVVAAHPCPGVLRRTPLSVAHTFGTRACSRRVQVDGRIVSASKTFFFVWSINGELLARHELSNYAADLVTAVVASEGPEWEAGNVVITGHADGTVRLWQLALLPGGARVIQPESALRICWRMSLCCELTLSAPAEDPRAVPARAAVRCLRVSRDQRRLILGDELGRVYSWSIPDATGASGDHWERDDLISVCTTCRVRFSIAERRHHCRRCGRIYCNKCSRFEATLPAMGITKLVRVCEPCFVWRQTERERDVVDTASGAALASAGGATQQATL